MRFLFNIVLVAVFATIFSWTHAYFGLKISEERDKALRRNSYYADLFNRLEVEHFELLDALYQCRTGKKRSKL
jgi:hypothetical protein